MVQAIGSLQGHTITVAPRTGVVLQCRRGALAIKVSTGETSELESGHTGFYTNNTMSAMTLELPSDKVWEIQIFLDNSRQLSGELRSSDGEVIVEAALMHLTSFPPQYASWMDDRLPHVLDKMGPPGF